MVTIIKKIGIITICLYGIYGLFIYIYLFHGKHLLVPVEYEGTSADPTTFLNAMELSLSEEFSQIRNFLFFFSIPYEWIVYFFVLLFGLSTFFKEFAEKISKSHWWQIVIYLFLLLLFTFIVTYPLEYIRYFLVKSYHISLQSFSSWMRDEIIGFWVNFIMMLLIVMALYWLIQKSSKRWWLYAWFLSIPFTIFFIFVQPVLIDPLYNDFYPLQNKQLEEKIIAMAEEADIPAEHVFEVNQSEKTNSLNAYVTGIGSNARIVLWDTTLNRLNENEILFIMAHEMAHYVEKHIYIGVVGYLILTLIILFLTNKIIKWSITRYGKVLKLTTIQDVRSLPLFLLIVSLLLFVSSPLTNYVSRFQETRADQYAIKLTDQPDAAISTFQELTRAGLSQVNPPLLVKMFRYGHPTMLERILMIEDYKKQIENTS